MNKTIDYFIDSENPERPAESDDLASFEYYFEEELNIKSVTLKSIMFYNSWWPGDSFANAILYTAITDDLAKSIISATKTFSMITGEFTPLFKLNTKDFSIPQRHFSLAEFCSKWEDNIKKNVDHVKIYCDQNNYLIIELLEDKEFSLEMIFNEHKIYIERFEAKIGGKDIVIPKLIKLLNNEWFGFKQEQFTKKGKYYSTKPLNFYRTSLFLRSNLVNKQNTFYNNKYSDIFCEFPVEDGDQIKFQIYEPLNCTKNVYKCTNHLKFEITDENGKVINFRGKPVKIHLSFEVFPFNK